MRTRKPGHLVRPGNVIKAAHLEPFKMVDIALYGTAESSITVFDFEVRLIVMSSHFNLQFVLHPVDPSTPLALWRNLCRQNDVSFALSWLSWKLEQNKCP